ncbi:MAG: hypothetical protein ACE5FJ_08550 [Gemmatimonadales bacterium]
MNDITRKRIMRKLDSLPDEALYEVVDYIDFIEKRHGVGNESPSPLQRLAEGVEDVLRAGKVPVAAIKGTMQAIDAAGKVMNGISAAGHSVVDELQKVAEPHGEKDSVDEENERQTDQRAAPADDDESQPSGA